MVFIVFLCLCRCPASLSITDGGAFSYGKALAKPELSGISSQDMAKMGRPTKRTPEIEAKLERALGNGLSRESASKFAGIGKETLNGWARKDATFRSKLAEIESEWELRMVEAATNGIAKQPKLAVDLLERRRASWNKDVQSNQVATNGRNSIAAALVVALMHAPETNAKRTPAPQVIDVQ